MAINLFNEYPQNAKAPDEDYPFGAFRNRTAPDATDGTTLEEKWSNDWQAFFSKLFVEASMTPSGEVDTVKVSQYYDALLALIHREKTEVSNALNGNRTDVASSENALRLSYELASAAVKKSGDTMTGDLSILNNLPSLTLRNATIPENNRGAKVTLLNSGGRGTFSTSNESGTNEIRHTLPTRGGELSLGNTSSGAQNGWLRDESTGIIMQWGVTRNSKVTFPIPYVNNCFSVTITHNKGGGVAAMSAYNISRNGFNTLQSYGDISGNWLAIGK